MKRFLCVLLFCLAAAAQNKVAGIAEGETVLSERTCYARHGNELTISECRTAATPRSVVGIRSSIYFKASNGCGFIQRHDSHPMVRDGKQSCSDGGAFDIKPSQDLGTSHGLTVECHDTFTWSCE
jgi:hypothetical protein